MTDQNFTPITMDMSLDDIGDVPNFDKWPTGAYLIGLEDGIVEKTLNDTNYLSAEFTLMGEPQEIRLHGSQTVPKMGDKMDNLFDMSNPYGAANYKKLAGPIQQATGAKTIREINENSKGLLLLVVVSSAFNKKKSDELGRDVYNTNIKMAALA